MLDDRAKQLEFAALVGVTRQAVSDLVRSGALPRGDTYRQWLTAYCQHLRDRVPGGTRLDLTAERAALAAAQRRVAELDAEKRGLELARMRDELLPADEVERTWTRGITHTRARLLAIPTSTAHALACASTPGACQAIVQEAIYQALTELSDPVSGAGGETEDPHL